MSLWLGMVFPYAKTTFSKFVNYSLCKKSHTAIARPCNRSYCKSLVFWQHLVLYHLIQLTIFHIYYTVKMVYKCWYIKSIHLIPKNRTSKNAGKIIDENDNTFYFILVSKFTCFITVQFSKPLEFPSMHTVWNAFWLSPQQTTGMDPSLSVMIVIAVLIFNFIPPVTSLSWSLKRIYRYQF